MVLETIRNFYLENMSQGDVISEFFYGFTMVIIVTGMINGFSFGGPQAVLLLLFLAFWVNVSWGIIDGTTVMLGGLIDRAEEDRLIDTLKKDRTNKELRQKLLDLLEESSVEYLDDMEKQRLIDGIIDAAPGKKNRYKSSKEERRTALVTMSCDTLAVIPVVIPYVLFGTGHLALTLSRGIAATVMAFLAYTSAKHRGGHPWAAAILFAVATIIIMIWSYEVGW